MSYLSPEEHDRETSIMPWMERSTALTDYNMIQRMFKNNTKMSSIDRLIGSFNRFSLSSIATAEMHQLALDASGLPASTSLAQVYLSTCKMRTTVPSKAAILGIALCVGAKLLQMKHISSDIGLEDSSADSIGVGLFVGLQSLLQLTSYKPPQVPEVEVPNLSLTLGGDKALFGEASGGTASIPSSLLDTYVKAIPTPINKSVEDNDDIAEVRAIDASWETFTTYVFDALSEIELKDYMPSLPVHDENPDDSQHLLGRNLKQKQPKQLISILQKAKQYKARSRKLTAGIKKRARGFKKGYIDLVENDGFFL